MKSSLQTRLTLLTFVLIPAGLAHNFLVYYRNWRRASRLLEREIFTLHLAADNDEHELW